MIVIHSNFSSTMLGFRDNDVLLPTGHDVIVSPPFQAIFYYVFCMRNHDFLIAFHSNFLSARHGLRDKEVSMSTGYDVIVSPPPGGALDHFI